MLKLRSLQHLFLGFYPVLTAYCRERDLSEHGNCQEILPFHLTPLILMMKTQIIDLLNPLWQETLQQLRHDIYHLPGYLDLEAKRSQSTP
jgi:hypothetical protein